MSKIVETIAEAAAPAVEKAMQIGESVADNIGQPVEVVFEVIQKTPVDKRRVVLIGVGVVLAGALAGAGYWYWKKKRQPKTVINGEVVDTPTVDDELNEMLKNEEAAAASNGSKNKK